MYASFSGNVGKDSEVITTKTGARMLKFSVADEVFQNGQKTTQWINCVDFRKASVDKLVEYIKKGSLLHVSGEVSLNSYEAKDGTVKTTLQCVVSGIRLHGNKNSESRQASPVTAQGATGTIPFDDDIPF